MIFFKQDAAELVNSIGLDFLLTGMKIFINPFRVGEVSTLVDINPPLQL